MDRSHRPGAAYAVVHDVAASWHEYPRVALTPTGAPLPGLLVHAAGPTDDGFRTIDIWDSEEAWQDHRDRWLTPLERLFAAPVAREFRVRHLAGELIAIHVDGRTRG